jgi:uncharacterized protein (DUF4213/DUF364 family)
MSEKIKILEEAKRRLIELSKERKLYDKNVLVLAKPLSPEEAIGKPGRRDFPIIKGKERVIEATIEGYRAHAFTDSPKEFTGTLEDVINLELNTNQNRAIFIATLNAVTGKLGLTDKTIHCKDDDPEECALVIAEQLLQKYGKIKVGLIGFNPAIAEKLVGTFGVDKVRITDLGDDIIGTLKFGVKIGNGDSHTKDLIEKSDFILFTGTTLVNNTFDKIFEMIKTYKKKYLVYGVTAAGIGRLFDIARICPKGKDSDSK